MISVQIRVLLIVFSIITAYGIIKKIKKATCRIVDSIFWIGFSMMLIIMGIVPQLPICLAELLGIESPVNFVYLIIIFLLLIKLFDLTIKLSVLTNKLEQLTRFIALEDVEPDRDENVK